jgi:1-acyl-sn-glycerol-3-phosphate acyltransferase
VRSHVVDRRSRPGAPPHEGFLRTQLRRLTRHGIAGELKLPDEQAIRETVRWAKPLCDLYFRDEVTGLERVPDEPTLLVGNHDGGYLPVDGICLGAAWHLHFGFRRPLTTLMHDFPFRIHAALTDYLSSNGVLPANRNNLHAALDRGSSVLLYPGGSHEAFRSFWQRRTVSLGHRTGFIAEALKRRAPISPIASVGAHETLFVLSRGSWLARRIPLARKLRSDVAPLWLGLPWGIGFGPLPHIPLPAKVKVEVLPPVLLWKELGETADPQDPKVLRAGLDLVRGRLQAAADRLYAERRWPLLG